MRERTRTNSGLPPNARAEILEALCANMEISSDEIVAILKRHHVAEDTGVLQDRYRRQLGQRLTAESIMWWAAPASPSSGIRPERRIITF